MEDHDLVNVIRDVASLLERNWTVLIFHANRSCNFVADILATIGRTKIKVGERVHYNYPPAATFEAYASEIPDMPAAYVILTYILSSFEEVVAIDESEFLKGIRLLGCGNRICYNGDSSNHVGERDKGVMINYESDDSVQIIGEKWNPIWVYDNESSDYDNGNSLAEAREGDNTGVNCGVHSSDIESSSSESDALSDHDFSVGNLEGSSSSEVCSRNGLDKHGDGDGRSIIKDKHDRKKKKKHKKISMFEFRKRVDEGLVCSTSQGKNYDVEKSLKGKRKKYNKKTDYPRKKSKEGALVSPRTDDVEGASSFSSDSHDDLQVPLSVRIPEDGGKREGVRPSKKKNVVLGSNLKKKEHNGVLDPMLEEWEPNVVLNDLDLVPLKKKRVKKLKAKDVEYVLLNTILENGSASALEDIVSPTIDTVLPTIDQDDLPRKFTFEDEKDPVPEKTESELEIDDLFKELDFGVGVCDIGAQTSCLHDNEEEDAILCDSAISQEKLCREGKHYLILDDEIGVKCKFCSIVVHEIRDVTPAFNDNPFGNSRNYGRLPSDHNNESDGSEFPDLIHDSGDAHGDETRGTVWNLIPGIKRTLYEHQQKGFEFIWRNIAGGIQIDELGKPSESSLGGCIICHAPGTGKTRLAIVFLQSYLKQYPMSKPVIIAPSSMLLTWEEEFARWHVDVPFVNLNSAELSSKEIEALNYVNKLKHSKAIRKAKLCIWAMGKGVLGISYRMFEKLAGERKGADEIIKKALLEQSGILVLDEGHTPKNEDSYIWKVFSEVKTKKRIILSGTPFQNNFVELNNTLSLIREEFGDPFLRGNHLQSGRKNKANKKGFYTDTSKVNEDRRIEDLRNRLKPFVHVHKGEILRKTLRGLFHSVLLLKPSELQKTYIRKLDVFKSGLSLDYLVSIVSVHPSLLYKCEQVPAFVDKEMLKKHEADLDVGDLLKLHFNWTEGNEFLFMEGKQRPKIRQSLIGQFNDPGSAATVLLASTKACCEGIHLVGASRVVLLDVVWNPSVERQAISRAYRLGQKKDVYVYHLITSGTLERDKYERQVAKERVSEKVFISSEAEGVHNTGTLSMISEDLILEEMVEHEKLKCMFEKIIYQPKVDNNLIESFGPLNL
uniref:Uncharacterized protein n=1 Tax=Chenopodium quinoa TaxID=63459 RepID=A0A803L5Q7_CHEQI